ncbi:MAG: sulfatase-like hydrolase/transferase [Polyangiales bacterium]|nr:sulfatase-like hydrolase/transferase [Myxococcales bacterium]MCB9658515.1 sulfatase-like hydrolase/transferase [Sandaracinaceae bacterium]
MPVPPDEPPADPPARDALGTRPDEAGRHDRASPPAGEGLAPPAVGVGSPPGAWLRAWLVGGLAATTVELAASLDGEVPFSASGALLVLGLFTLAAVLCAAVTAVLEALVAPGGLDRVSASARGALALRADEETRARRVSGRILSSAVATVALVFDVALAVALVVRTTRSDTWVPLASGLLALPAVGGALLVGLAVRRAFDTLPRVPTPRVLLASLALAALLLSALLVATHHETLSHLGAYALCAPTALVLVALAVFVRAPRGLRRPAPLGLALAVLAAATVVLSWRQPSARAFAGRATWSTGYLVAGLQSLSDLDRDGVASFPFGGDCAPLDATRNPLARELPGNGVDENCDGTDSVVEASPARAAESAFVPLSGVAPDLFLITVDALRADHLGFMGYRTHPTSPDLDAVAERGIVFERAYSQDSGTGPSLWSLMVGKTPFQVELVAEGFPPNYAESETTLAEHLKAAGYTTHARLCGSLFANVAWNLRRGFDEFDEVCHRRPRDLGPFVLESARALLAPPADDAAPGDLERAPRFVWLHFFDPHHPYVDHEAVRFGEQSIDLYDEEIHHVQAFVAEALRLVLDPAHTRPRYAVLSADHGENFGEHGRDPHARTLYREVTHVPLVFLGSDVLPRRVPEPVATGDVFPTLLNLAGVPTPSSATMESLLPTLLGGSPAPDRPIFQENSWSRPTHHVKALIRGRYHLIRDLTTDTVELYDMLADPRERNNLVDDELPEQRQLMQTLETFIGTTNVPEAYR